MSLKDIIDGAREEAQANAADLTKSKKSDEKSEDAADEKRTGFSKRSVAKAKPAREAASSVRLESKPHTHDPLKDETKEERKERRRREREQEDLRTRAYDVIMKSIPGYKETDRTFWILMSVGFACAIVSAVLTWAVAGSNEASLSSNVVSFAVMIVAYVFIIASFVYDLRKRRPFRREAEARLRSMNEKKLVEVLQRDRAEQLAVQAQKDAKKAARKSR